MHFSTCNTSATLCQPCHSMFEQENSPLILTSHLNSLVPSQKTHHQTVQSFRNATIAGCFICSIVDTEFPKNILVHSEPATTFHLRRIPLGYRILITIRSNNQDTAVYLTVAKFDKTMVTNVSQPLQKALVSKWISDCSSGTERHAPCHRRRLAGQNVRRGPRILLSIRRERTEMPKFQIVHGASITSSTHYATVSQYHRVTQQISNFKLDSISSHSLEVLPETLQDALNIVMSAGISHAWVPGLCSDAYDNHQEVVDIYASADFNVAMLDSPASIENIDSPLCEQSEMPVINLGWCPDELFAIYSNECFSDLLKRSPLWSQASFHRDYILAPATIFCSKQQLWFKCSAGTPYSSWFPAGLKNGRFPALSLTSPYGLDPKSFDFADFGANYRSFHEGLAAFWTSVVAELSGAVAENMEAKIKMVDSLAAKIKQQGTPCASAFDSLSHAHGVWSSMVAYQVAWCSSSNLAGDAPEAPERTTSRLPTWSWLSVSGAVEFEFLINSSPGQRMPSMWPDVALPLATITFERTPSPAELPLSLSVKGRLLKATPEFPTAPRGNDRDCFTEVDSVGKIHVTWDRIDEFQRAIVTQTSNSFAAWPIFVVSDENSTLLEASGLLLRQALAKDKFVRCGWFRYFESSNGSTKSSALVKMANGDESAFTDFTIE